jgi:thioredoxin-related protein
MHLHRIKGLLVMALLVAATRPCLAADRDWHDDVDAAWNEARQHERPLLLFISTAGCRYCTMMQNGTFSDPAVAELITQGFVPAAVNADDVAWLVKSEKIASYPTTLVISREAKVIEHIRGYVKPAELKPRLARTAAVERTASRPQTAKQ